MFKLTNSKFKVTDNRTPSIGGGSSNEYPEQIGAEVEIKGF